MSPKDPQILRATTGVGGDTEPKEQGCLGDGGLSHPPSPRRALSPHPPLTACMPRGCQPSYCGGRAILNEWCHPSTSFTFFLNEAVKQRQIPVQSNLHSRAQSSPTDGAPIGAAQPQWWGSAGPTQPLLTERPQGATQPPGTAQPPVPLRPPLTPGTAQPPLTAQPPRHSTSTAPWFPSCPH